MFRSNKRRLCLFLATALSGCIPAIPHVPEAGVSSTLVGTWRLLEYAAWDSAGKAQQVFGPAPSGYAVLDRVGTAFVQIMKPGDAATLAAYYGAYTVNAAGDSLRIRVEGTNIPAYLGTVQTRPFRIRGDTLILGIQGKYQATLVRITGH